MVAERGARDIPGASILLTTEAGSIGGTPAGGPAFGAASHPLAQVPTATMLDFYNGGGIDVAFLVGRGAWGGRREARARGPARGRRPGPRRRRRRRPPRRAAQSPARAAPRPGARPSPRAPPRALERPARRPARSSARPHTPPPPTPPTPGRRPGGPQRRRQRLLLPRAGAGVRRVHRHQFVRQGGRVRLLLHVGRPRGVRARRQAHHQARGGGRVGPRRRRGSPARAGLDPDPLPPHSFRHRAGTPSLCPPSTRSRSRRPLRAGAACCT